MAVVELAEAGPAVEVALTAEQAGLIDASGVVALRASRRQAGFWRVQAKHKVGAVRVGDTELHISPKTPVARLLFLVGYSRDPRSWRDDLVSYATSAGLVPAFAQALWRQTDQALRQGLLQGYRTIDQTSSVLRGRLRESDQMCRQRGLPLPLEIHHDEYTYDIPENRILATAVQRMRRVPGIDDVSRRMLRHLAARFVGVTPLRPREPAPVWYASRLNTRYHVALQLAELVLVGTSIETPTGEVSANGFLVDMWRVFEDFVTVAFRERVVSHHGGRVVAQQRHHLDEANEVELRPDIVWQEHGSIRAVVDAKYTKKSQPDDFYQLLAYCTTLDLRSGHLVYAAGAPRKHTVRRAGIQITCHVLNLNQTPAELLRQVRGLADEVCRTA